MASEKTVFDDKYIFDVTISTRKLYEDREREEHYVALVQRANIHTDLYARLDKLGGFNGKVVDVDCTSVGARAAGWPESQVLIFIL